MEALIVLATTMAIFGVIGYLRGTKFSLFYAALGIIGIMLLKQVGDTLARMMDLFYRVGRAMLGGGFKAISSEGEGGFSKLGELVSKVPPLIDKENQQIALALVLLFVMFLGFLLSSLKIFKSKASYPGLALGLLTGYLVGEYGLQALAAFLGVNLALPAWLLGSTQQAAASAPSGPSLGSTLLSKIVSALNSLADSGQIALVIAIAIALFVLLATRLGNRGVKKG